jgi:hypothetical protein
MTVCPDEAAGHSDETYWVGDNAAQPVLLIDEATEAITEALHRVRHGSVLDDRDLAAAQVAFDDLLGGLRELADLLSTPVGHHARAIPQQVRRLDDRLATLRAMRLSA